MKTEQDKPWTEAKSVEDYITKHGPTTFPVICRRTRRTQQTFRHQFLCTPTAHTSTSFIHSLRPSIYPTIDQEEEKEAKRKFYEGLIDDAPSQWFVRACGVVRKRRGEARWGGTRWGEMKVAPSICTPPERHVESLTAVPCVEVQRCPKPLDQWKEDLRKERMDGRGTM